MSTSDGYIRGRKLGEGTWGIVYEATRKVDGMKVAIKRMKGRDAHYGIDFTAIREVKVLKEIKGPNVVDLLDVYISGGIVHLVMEYCLLNLEDIIKDKSIHLRSPHHKSYLQMILRGIDMCHSAYILHRDIKPGNILIRQTGEICLTDFGLAKEHGSPVALTPTVVTLWYRAPELLYGAKRYGPGVDIWAIGCVFAEIILRTPLFPAETDLEQLAKIFNVLGTPSNENWPNVSLLPNYVEFESREPISLVPLFGFDGNVDNRQPLLDLLLRMLTLDPNKRISAKEALQHPYFQTSPEPCEPSQLPLPKSTTIEPPTKKMRTKEEGL